MEEFVLQAENRDVIGKQVKALRRQGILPGIIYGRNIESIAISLDARDAVKLLSTVSSSLLMVVEVDGNKHTVLVRERQRDPVTDIILHVDFLEVSMTEKLRTTVAIVLDGEAPAAKSLGGILVLGPETLEVECLPGDLPERIRVDLSVLEKIGDAIYVRDLPVADEVDILTSVDEIVALITAPSAEPEPEEEEIEELLEAEMEEPEVIERGKREDEDED